MPKEHLSKCCKEECNCVLFAFSVKVIDLKYYNIYFCKSLSAAARYGILRNPKPFIMVKGKRWLTSMMHCKSKPTLWNAFQHVYSIFEEYIYVYSIELWNFTMALIWNARTLTNVSTLRLKNNDIFQNNPKRSFVYQDVLWFLMWQTIFLRAHKSFVAVFYISGSH